MPDSGIQVSVVIPCYNEEGSLRALHERIRAQFVQLGLTAEVIYVDDGSTDGSRALLRELAAADPLCRLIFFRRNCGKAAALDVGFRAALGDYILTMDADLQDDPDEIPRFLEALGRVDLVSGWKAKRHDPLGKTLPSRLFNFTVREVTGVKLHDMNCGFKGYRRQVVQELHVYGELHRYLPALAAARGFTIEELVVTHHPRRSGVSKYGWERFVRGFLDLITVVYITKYRMRPLHFFGAFALGLLLFVLATGAITSLYLTNAYLAAHNYQLPGWLIPFWVFDGALLAAALAFFAVGVVAEGIQANAFRLLPPPPIAERVNAADEVSHAG